LIIFNTGNVASLNLFSIQFEEVPVIVIAITSFVAGALYALLLQVITYVNKRQKRKSKETKKEPETQTEDSSSAGRRADKDTPLAQSVDKSADKSTNKRFPFFGKRKQKSTASEIEEEFNQ
jgi:cytoskeletal protein RodZ